MSSPYHTLASRGSGGEDDAWDDGALMDAYNEAVERYKREHNLASGAGPQALSPSVGAKPGRSPPPARAPRARSARGDDDAPASPASPAPSTSRREQHRSPLPGSGRGARADPSDDAAWAAWDAYHASRGYDDAYRGALPRAGE